MSPTRAFGYVASRHIAMPMPPPMHSVARPFLASRLLHFVQQRDQHTRAGRTDRMTDGDGAAIDVDLRRIPAEILVDRAGLRGESLIGLDQVEVVDLPAGLLQRRARGRDRAGAHDRRIDAGMGPRHDAGQRLEARAWRPRLAFISTTAAAPSLMPEALAAVTVPSLSKAGRSLADRLERGAVARIFSSVVDDDVALAPLDGDRRDLVLELAGLLRGLGLVLRADRELVLLVRA